MPKIEETVKEKENWTVTRIEWAARNVVEKRWDGGLEEGEKER